MPSNKVITLGISASITVILALVLTIFVIFSYQAKDNKLVEGGCIIVSAEQEYEYIYVGKGSNTRYFYEVGTGDRKTIWWSKSYYTINVNYAVPEQVNNPLNYATYKDGYNSDFSRNSVYAGIIFNQTTTKCWYDPEYPEDVTVTHDPQVGGEIAGVCIFTILTAAALIFTIIVFIFFN